MSEIALAVVAPVVPDVERFRTKAFSRAANSYIRHLLEALGNAGVEPQLVLSFEAVPAFPRGRRVLVTGRNVRLETGTSVHLMTYLNLPGVKQVWLGLATLLNLCFWAATSGRAKNRVIYCFNLTVPPGVFVLTAARITGSKLAVSLNDIGVPGETVPNRWRERLDFWFQGWLIPRCDGHIAVADAIMEDFAPARSWLRIEGGVTDQQMQPRRRLPVERPRHFTTLLAGGLEEVNGLRLVLAAAALDRDGATQWLIAGAGPLLNVVTEADRLLPNVHYLGFLSPEDLDSAYRSADLLLNIRLTRTVHTKYFFPSKLIEYLATGAPVLTTATGHAIEEFGPFVFQLDDETPEGLLRAVARVAAVPEAERLQMGVRARQYVGRTKHWNRHGEALARYLSNVALRRPMPASRIEAV